MTARVAHIFRHPLKAIGREELPRVSLAAGRWMPWDRVWAVAHHRARIEPDAWAQKANFLRGVTEPRLMAATARLDEAAGRLCLAHPDAGALDIRPDDAADTPVLLDWLSRIWPADLPAPAHVYRTSQAHLTDVPDPWISVHNLATHRAVEQRVGRPLSIHRWRGNLWIEGLAPWQEFEWLGREIRLGGATLRVEERITRCKATMANPETGRRDADTLAALRSWDHQDFGVYAVVVDGGDVARDDPAGV